MSEVTRVAKRLAALDGAIARGKAVIKVLESRARYLRESVLPELVDGLDWDPETMVLDEAGDEIAVTFPDMVVNVKDTFHPEFPKKDAARRKEILDWIENNGGDSLLTLEVSLVFRTGEGKIARKVLKAIQNADPDHKQRLVKEPSLHYQSFQKFCRDRYAAGLDMPEFLGVFNRRAATVELAKPEPVPMILEERRGIPPVRDASQGYGE